jgi:electron transport complex protein RnfG
MKKFLIPAIVILCAAAILLGLTFGLNKIAIANADAEHLKIMQTLLPGSKDFIVEPYTGEDANIRSVHKADGYGYVIETVTAGYAGDIRMLIGVDNDGKVTGLVIREMNETAGLGMNALNDTDFLSQFLNKDTKFKIGTDGVDAITGATVTSKAVVRCINSAIAHVTGDDTGVDGDSGATSWGG